MTPLPGGHLAFSTALTAVVVASAARSGSAQQGTPLGPEFRVNTYTTASQRSPSVAADAAGSFVVVWHGAQASGYDVFGQRYAAGGSPQGPEFRVNTYTTGLQGYGAVAADAAGNFVVVWMSTQGAGFDVFGQRYASSGAPLGGEFRVNTYTTGAQGNPSVAADASGNFVVAWVGEQDASYGVFAQRFASSGAPLGPEFRVNTYTTGAQYGAVASDTAGNFVVAWTSFAQDGSQNGVFAQRYASSGAPAGPEFRVNTYTPFSQWHAAVAADGPSGFVVAWESQVQDASLTGVFGQRYASAGAPLGPEFRVNTYTTNEQSYPSVATDGSGDFVVVWRSRNGQDGALGGIYGQRYDSAGSPLGPEFRVNSYTTGDQSEAAVASAPAGEFVIAWTSDGQDGSALGVYAQRYGPIVPVELMRFGVD
jgi:hypothetical protein